MSTSIGLVVPLAQGAKGAAKIIVRMRLRALGKSDLRVSLVGVGCNNFGYSSGTVRWRPLERAESRAVVDAALDVGINFFDAADLYGDGDCERFLGDALTGRREDAIVATKFGYGVESGGSRAYVRQAIDASLSRLRMDYVDLYYYHVPDGTTPIEETIGALEELVMEGKVRAIGCSNLTPMQLREVLAAAGSKAGSPLVALQNRYNLLDREPERELIPLSRQHGLGFVPHSPLASGLLTGKYRRGAEPPAGSRLAKSPERLTDDVFDRLERLEAFAQERGYTLLELAIASLASSSGVASVIAGAMDPAQVRSNAAAAEWELTPAELHSLAAIAPRRRWHTAGWLHGRLPRLRRPRLRR
jgi:aryl-alcohol dehydrogenase-like predicted oxidoreductase